MERRWCVTYCVFFDADSIFETLFVGPKLVFSYTIAQSPIPWFARYV